MRGQNHYPPHPPTRPPSLPPGLLSRAGQASRDFTGCTLQPTVLLIGGFAALSQPQGQTPLWMNLAPLRRGFFVRACRGRSRIALARDEPDADDGITTGHEPIAVMFDFMTRTGRWTLGG
jgi:hypothetical protein